MFSIANISRLFQSPALWVSAGLAMFFVAALQCLGGDDSQESLPLPIYEGKSTLVLENHPDITLSGNNASYRNILPHQVILQKYRITNDSVEPVSVEKIQTGCTCTVPQDVVLPAQIEPGGTFDLPIRVKSGGVPGLSKNVVVISTDKGVFQASFRVHVLDVISPKVISFGALVRGEESKSVPVTIRLPKGKSLNPVPSSQYMEQIHCRLVSQKQSPENNAQSHIFKVSVCPRQDAWGDVNQEIEFPLAEGGKPVVLRVQYTVKAPYTFHPKEVSCGAMSSTNRKEFRISLLSENDNNDTRLIRCETRPEITQKELADKYCLFELNGEQLSQGVYESTITLHLSNNTITDIPVKAFILTPTHK